MDLTGGEDESEHSHLDQRPADCATEPFDGELEQGLEAQLRDALAAVERAERRLEEGTDGRSVESGQPIPGARLEAIPSGGAHREGAGAPRGARDQKEQDMRIVVSQTSRSPVAAYDSYAEAQRAVDHLSDRGLPVGKVAILGHGLRYVEQVAGRYTTGRAALVGVLEGAPSGAFLGLLMGLSLHVRPESRRVAARPSRVGGRGADRRGARCGASPRHRRDAGLLVGASYAGRAPRGGSRRRPRRPGGRAAALGRLSRAA